MRTVRFAGQLAAAAQKSRDGHACLCPFLFPVVASVHQRWSGPSSSQRPGDAIVCPLGGWGDSWLTLPSAASSLASVRALLSVLLADSVFCGVGTAPHLEACPVPFWNTESVCCQSVSAHWRWGPGAPQG